MKALLGCLLGLAALIVAAPVLGSFAAWGAATSATNLTLSATNAFSQLAIFVLVITLIALVAFVLFVAVKAFNLGRRVERRRADEDLDDMQRQLARARSQAPKVVTPIMLMPGVTPPALPRPPADRPLHRVRRVRTANRAALQIAKRWFQ